MSFRDFVMDHPRAASADMHLTHCTSGGNCFDILADLALAPTECPVYGADLLYLFYGRPAFKPNAKVGASTLAETAPVCLVIDPSVLGDAIRILPFDSGGFERYESHLGPGLNIEAFELQPEATAPLRLVQAFFETTENYYMQVPRTGPAIRASQRAAAGYQRLLADQAIAHDDDRRGTIEIQLDRRVSLPQALRALIGPAAVMDDPAVQNALGACPDAVPIHYSTYGRMRPIGLSYAIYDRLAAFFQARNWFA